MQQIHIDRLNRLIYDLEQMKLAPEQRATDIGVLRNGFKFDIGDVGLAVIEAGHICGTVCCIAGTAAMDPVFMAQGLTHAFLPSYSRFQLMVLKLDGNPVTYDDEQIAHWFGLQTSDWLWLVSPGEYTTNQRDDPSAAIDRIRLFLSEYQRSKTSCRYKKPPSIFSADVVEA